MKLKSIVYYFLISAFIISFMSAQVMAAENPSDNKIQPTKNNADLLKQQLRETKYTLAGFDSKTLKLNADFNVFPAASKIDLVLRDMDVASVLRLIAKEGHKNIVLDQSVQGTINADLKRVSLNEAMQTILTSQELEVRVQGNTIYVASRPAMARKGLNRKYIKAFRLNNANAVEIASILEASIFNKGYAVNEASSSGNNQASAMQAISDPNQQSTQSQPASQASSAPQGTSTGQSTLVSSKTIKGKVETLTEGLDFNDASKPASSIKLQRVTSASQDITVNNNDNGAIVIPDTRTNSVLVAGLEDDILLAEQAISYLDKPLQQVSIEVSLIEIKKDDSNDLGLLVSSQTGKYGAGFNRPMTDTSFSTIASQTGVSYSSIQNIHDNIQVRLNALIQNNKAKLLANPTVIALDGSESFIKITDRIVSNLQTTSNQGVVTYNTTLEDIGIVLNILPKISDNGYVTMRVRPSITTPLTKITIGSGVNGTEITPVSTREIILQDVRVKAGETLTIAGLLKDSDIEQIGKLPVAGDLPIFGALFRNKTRTHNKTEIVILITPKIVSDTASNNL